MSTPSESAIVRRVLVALDASRQSLLALDAAARLAEWHDAELQGLYVEDINLIRLASLSVSREISPTLPSTDPIDSRLLARRLSSSAAEAEHCLAEAAGRRHVRWDFRVERGDVTAVISNAARDADIVALGRAGTGTSGRGRLGSTARALAFRQSQSVIVIQAPLTSGRAVVALFDGSAASARAVRASAQLSKHLATRLVIFVPVGDDIDPARRSQLLEDAAQLVSDPDCSADVRSVTSANRAVARAIQSEYPVLFVAACQPESSELIRQLTDQLRMSMFLVK